MNILVVGGRYFVQALRQLGHEVVHAHYDGSADLPLAHPTYTAPLLAKLATQGFVPDLLLYADDGNVPLLLNPEAFPCPSIWYSIDTYCNPWHMAWGHGFDASLVAQKDFVHMFANEGLRAAWLPLFCQGAEDVGVFAERDMPVSFVGTLGHKNNPGREPFLKAFRKQHPLVMLTGNYRPVFLRSRIVLNQTAFAEVNFRCFEAMACGAALLMEQCDNGLLDIFTPDVDILPPYTRGDAAGAASIAASYLARPEHLEAIAARGRELVAQKHSAMARTRQIMEVAATLHAEKAHEARLAQVGTHTRFVKTAFGIIASDVTDPDKSALREFYMQRASS